MGNHFNFPKSERTDVDGSSQILPLVDSAKMSISDIQMGYARLRLSVAACAPADALSLTFICNASMICGP